VIAEAMSYSKPLVATRVGGIPELVQDGRTGFVVDRGDVRALADRILELTDDRELRDRMGRAGRRDAEAKFDLERNVARVLASYSISATTPAKAVRESLASVS
jgi:glycosyltransferase involved in cell wall biosynthesis